MSLQSTAAELIVIDPATFPQMGGHTPEPMEVVDMMSHDHDHESEENHEHSHEHEDMEVQEPVEVEIVIDDLPGAPHGTQDPVLEVAEPAQDAMDVSPVIDENDAKKSKKNEKWDWESKGAEGFITWVKERIDDVPKHSGYDSAGLERAVSYLEKLDNEISRAMRLDLDGELDANKIEDVRSKIDDGISRLHDRLDKVKKHKKTSRKKKSEQENLGLVKEAQKITGVQGVFIMADLLTSRIARVCINGMVSAGHSIEDIYNRQVKEYNLNKRERVCVMQLLADMGYPLRQDRGYMPEEDVDISSSDNFDWAANYKG